MELDAADLAMTRAEAARLLHGVGLASSRGRCCETPPPEGWPAALYLAALTLSELGIHAEPAVDRFTGDDRIVADYVRDEFLSSLTPDDLEFHPLSSLEDRAPREKLEIVGGQR